MNDVDQIINTVLNIFREQTDSKSDSVVSNSIDVDPKSFSSGSHVVVGPIDFFTSFQSPPEVNFTQYGPSVDSDIRIAPSASNYTPFLIYPYVYGWKWESGAVDGFFIGMYALTSPKELPSNHRLGWQVSGKASRYLSPISQEIWSSEDNSFRPDYLMEDS